jgi:hypothetical protein
VLQKEDLMTNKPVRQLYRSQEWLDDVNEPDSVDDTANQDDGTEASAPATPAPELTPEEKSYKNRYDSLKAHYDKTVTDLRKELASVQDQFKKTTSEKLDVPINEEELKEWRTAYPELYKVVRMVSRLEANESTKSLQEKLDRVQEREQVSKRESAEASLLRLHPDFPELSQNQEFRDWLDDQPAQIQSWLYDNSEDPLLAGKAITMYKLEKGIGQKRKRDTTEDASIAVTRTRADAQPNPDKKQKEWRASEVQKLNPRQYEKYEDEIDAAIAEGRFINDI